MLPGSSVISTLAVTGWPLTVVPLVLPSSRSTKRPSRNVIEAWAREILRGTFTDSRDGFHGVDAESVPQPGHRAVTIVDHVLHHEPYHEGRRWACRYGRFFGRTL